MWVVSSSQCCDGLQKIFLACNTFQLFFRSFYSARKVISNIMSHVDVCQATPGMCC